MSYRGGYKVTNEKSFLYTTTYPYLMRLYNKVWGMVTSLKTIFSFVTL